MDIDTLKGIAVIAAPIVFAILFAMMRGKGGGNSSNTGRPYVVVDNPTVFVKALKHVGRGNWEVTFGSHGSASTLTCRLQRSDYTSNNNVNGHRFHYTASWGN